MSTSHFSVSTNNVFLPHQRVAGAALTVVGLGLAVVGASMLYDTVKETGGKLARLVDPYISSVSMMAVGTALPGAVYLMSIGK